MNSASEWNLMEQGLYGLAYEKITEHIDKNPQDFIRYAYNRGLCLLNLEDPKHALLDFEKLIDLRPDSDSGYIGAGIALWWLNRKIDAVNMWKNAIKCKYTDAAGGVMGPALIFFASSMLNDLDLEKYSIRILKAKYRTKRAGAWPGPIAGFILGKITETDLLEKAVQRPGLRARILTKAHFWIGVFCFRQNNIDGFRDHLYQSHMGHIIEPEYYLAKYELKSLKAKFNQ